jgi:hypothetical protein
MKRNEMTKKIQLLLNDAIDSHSNACPEFEGTDEWANKILLTIEELGMLPPKYLNITDIKELPGIITGTVVDVYEWESEGA